MEIYAGMVSNLDHNIGLLIQHLKDIGEYDDTFIMFQSDNGAEGWPINSARPEGDRRGQRRRPRVRDARQGQRSCAGAVGIQYGLRWAEVSATPLAMTKGFSAKAALRRRRSSSCRARPKPLHAVHALHARHRRHGDVPRARGRRAAHHARPAADRPATGKDQNAGKVVYKGRAVYPVTGHSLVGLFSSNTQAPVWKQPFGEELYGRTASYSADGQWKARFIEPTFGPVERPLAALSHREGPRRNDRSVRAAPGHSRGPHRRLADVHDERRRRRTDRNAGILPATTSAMSEARGARPATDTDRGWRDGGGAGGFVFRAAGALRVLALRGVLQFEPANVVARVVSSPGNVRRVPEHPTHATPLARDGRERGRRARRFPAALCATPGRGRDGRARLIAAQAYNDPPRIRAPRSRRTSSVACKTRASRSRAGACRSRRRCPTRFSCPSFKKGRAMLGSWAPIAFSGRDRDGTLPVIVEGPARRRSGGAACAGAATGGAAPGPGQLGRSGVPHAASRSVRPPGPGPEVAGARLLLHVARTGSQRDQQHFRTRSPDASWNTSTRRSSSSPSPWAYQGRSPRRLNESWRACSEPTSLARQAATARPLPRPEPNAPAVEAWLAPHDLEAARGLFRHGWRRRRGGRRKARISAEAVQTYLDAGAGKRASGVERSLHTTIKPIGSVCNLDCNYCYYLSKDELLDHKASGTSATSTWSASSSSTSRRRTRRRSSSPGTAASRR